MYIHTTYTTDGFDIYWLLHGEDDFFFLGGNSCAKTKTYLGLL